MGCGEILGLFAVMEEEAIMALMEDRKSKRDKSNTRSKSKEKGSRNTNHKKSSEYIQPFKMILLCWNVRGFGVEINKCG